MDLSGSEAPEAFRTSQEARLKARLSTQVIAVTPTTAAAPATPPTSCPP